jgi:hypothetical protein
VIALITVQKKRVFNLPKRSATSPRTTFPAALEALEAAMKFAPLAAVYPRSREYVEKK